MFIIYFLRYINFILNENKYKKQMKVEKTLDKYFNKLFIIQVFNFNHKKSLFIFNISYFREKKLLLLLQLFKT